MLKHNHTEDSWFSRASSSDDSSTQASVSPHLLAYPMPSQNQCPLHPVAKAAASVDRPLPIPQNDAYSANRRAGSCTNSAPSRQGNGSAKASGGNVSQMQLQQMQQQPTLYSSQQTRLRQVERRLRSSLNLPTILGSTVVETAALFDAQQVSLLRYSRTNQHWQPVAQFCENQSLAWRQPIAIEQAAFPHLMQQLRHGKSLRLFSDHLSQQVTTPSDVVNVSAAPTFDKDALAAPSIGKLSVDGQMATETSQWLTCWPGNWLLVPVKNRHSADYSSRVLAHPTSDNSLTDSAVVAGLKASATDLHAEAFSHKSPSDHWGFIALAFPTQKMWSASAITATQSITLELALAMEQAEQYQALVAANQELQKLALSDGLTRLANRRRFDDHLSNEWQRLARDQQPLSLILCDLDHFKRYNDSFGHPAGDRCLIRVARALLNGPQRPADLVARYGGEEFAIVLPNTDTNGAWRIAQKVHESIRALQIAHAPHHEKAHVTVTMGVSTMVPSHDTTAQMLIQASDLALYYAKQQGRNRTYVHGHYNIIDQDTVVSTGDSSRSNLKIMPTEGKTSA